MAVIQERENRGETIEQEYERSVGVWQGSTLGSVTSSMTPWIRVADLMTKMNGDKLAAAFISNADDII